MTFPSCPVFLGKKIASDGEAAILTARRRKEAITLLEIDDAVDRVIAGIHKFYLGQPLWGIIYLLLWQTPIPRVACAIDAVWYLIQDNQFLAGAGPQDRSVLECCRPLFLKVDGFL